MSISYCKHNNNRFSCKECRGLSNHASSKIINIANHNIKTAHDEASERLRKAKMGEGSASQIFEKDGMIYMHHQNTLINFTPEQAIAMSEGLMTLGWELKEEKENEDGKQRHDTTGSSEESGEPVEDEGETKDERQTD